MLSREVIAARHAAPGALVAARKRVLGDPRSLYGRGGGVFGLARLSDRMMEAWMANPVLNGNSKVATWHESQQKCGFKFLVTQIMGYLTGGPQRYTGRPMDEAHKHLSITTHQWNTFMQDAKNVFREFNLDPATEQELSGILSTYQTSCVLAPGEVAPADPGRSRTTGTENTLYHRLGGVYPIAQFVDRLVEKVLTGDRVHIQHDRLDDPTGRRHPPGLKYMLTELVCHGTGGPEVVTSKGFDDAKLGVRAEEWPDFLQLAAEAAELWPLSHLRNSVLSALGAMKAEICTGIVAEDTSEEARARRMVQEAGFDHYLATSALERCGGDPLRALELLTRGWEPDNEETMSMPGTTSSMSSMNLDPDAPRCPFACPGAAPPAGHPPLGAGAGSGSSQAAAPVDDQLGLAIRALAEKGMAAAQIAPLLSLSEASVVAVLAQGPSVAQGRVLGSDLQKRLDDLLEEEADFCCPVSLMLYVDPVIASDGFMYEKASIQGLLRNRMVSPMTREPLKLEFLPARQRKSATLEFRQKRSAELLAFAKDAVASQPQMAATALQRASEYVEVLKPDTVPELSRQAAELWRKVGQPVPAFLISV
jgi:hemoglobin